MSGIFTTACEARFCPTAKVKTPDIRTARALIGFRGRVRRGPIIVLPPLRAPHLRLKHLLRDLPAVVDFEEGELVGEVAGWDLAAQFDERHGRTGDVDGEDLVAPRGTLRFRRWAGPHGGEPSIAGVTWMPLSVDCASALVGWNAAASLSASPS
jgi:hypothetical protein